MWGYGTERLGVVACGCARRSGCWRGIVESGRRFCRSAPSSEVRRCTRRHATCGCHAAARDRRLWIRRHCAIALVGCCCRATDVPASSDRLTHARAGLRRVIRHTLADHRRALETMISSASSSGSPFDPCALSDGPMTGSYRIDPDGLPRNGRSIARADVADFMLKQVGRRPVGLHAQRSRVRRSAAHGAHRRSAEPSVSRA